MVNITLKIIIVRVDQENVYVSELESFNRNLADVTSERVEGKFSP